VQLGATVVVVVVVVTTTAAGGACACKEPRRISQCRQALRLRHRPQASPKRVSSGESEGKPCSHHGAPFEVSSPATPPP